MGWSVPLDEGGSPILDYQVSWDDGLGSSMRQLVSSVGGPVQQWTTSGTTTLVAGVRYKFSVQAVNAIGAGQASSVVGIYAAEIP